MDPRKTDEEKLSALKGMLETIRKLGEIRIDQSNRKEVGSAHLKFLNDLKEIAPALKDIIKSGNVSNTCKAFAVELLVLTPGFWTNIDEIEKLVGSENISKAIINYKEDEVWAKAALSIQTGVCLSRKEGAAGVHTLYRDVLKDMVANAKNDDLRWLALSMIAQTPGEQAIEDLRGMRPLIIGIMKGEMTSRPGGDGMATAIDAAARVIAAGGKEGDEVFGDMKSIIQNAIKEENTNIVLKVQIMDLLAIPARNGIASSILIIEENRDLFGSYIRAAKEGAESQDLASSAESLLVAAAERGSEKVLAMEEEAIKDEKRPQIERAVACSILGCAALKGNSKAVKILIESVSKEKDETVKKVIIDQIMNAAMSGEDDAIKFIQEYIKPLLQNGNVRDRLIKNLFGGCMVNPKEYAKKVFAFMDILFDMLEKNPSPDNEYYIKTALAKVLRYNNGELLKMLENKIAPIKETIISKSSPLPLKMANIDLLVKMAEAGSAKAIICIKEILSKMIDMPDKEYQSVCLRIIGGALRSTEPKLAQSLIDDRQLTGGIGAL
ncbi:MAG: hypothetical protein AABZ57_08600, partial [Candidatus Margulisiibacteriota bacterium]